MVQMYAHNSQTTKHLQKFFQKKRAATFRGPSMVGPNQCCQTAGHMARRPSAEIKSNRSRSERIEQPFRRRPCDSVPLQFVFVCRANIVQPRLNCNPSSPLAFGAMSKRRRQSSFATLNDRTLARGNRGKLFDVATLNPCSCRWVFDDNSVPCLDQSGQRMFVQWLTDVAVNLPRLVGVIAGHRHANVGRQRQTFDVWLCWSRGVHAFKDFQFFNSIPLHA